MDSIWLFDFDQISDFKCILLAYIYVFWNPHPIPHFTIQFPTKNHVKHFKQPDSKLKVIPADNHRDVSIECQKILGNYVINLVIHPDIFSTSYQTYLMNSVN